MSYRIISISRQFGAGGRTVAKALSDILGLPVHDRDLDAMVAKRSGLPEDYVERKAELASGRFFASFLAKRDMNGHSTQDDVWNTQADIIREIAEKEACIFVGKSAEYVLKERDDVLAVFLCAPKEYRAEKLKDAPELKGCADPVKYIHERDKKRAMHSEFYTGRRWDDPRQYHMVLDVGKLGEELCIRLIVDAFREGN